MQIEVIMHDKRLESSSVQFNAHAKQSKKKHLQT